MVVMTLQKQTRWILWSAALWKHRRASQTLQCQSSDGDTSGRSMFPSRSVLDCLRNLGRVVDILQVSDGGEQQSSRCSCAGVGVGAEPAPGWYPGTPGAGRYVQWAPVVARTSKRNGKRQ